MRHLRIPALSAFAILAVAGTVLAADDDARIRPAVWGAYGSDTDFGIGGGVVVPLPKLNPNLNLVGGFTYHFANVDDMDFTEVGEDGTVSSKSDATYWQIHADLLKDFELNSSSVRPYVGAGIAYAHAAASATITYSVPGEEDDSTTISLSDNTAILNLVAGATFGTGKAKPFLQVTLQIEDGSQILISGGIRF